MSLLSYVPVAGCARGQATVAPRPHYPRDRLEAYRQDILQWLEVQRGLWLENDLVLVCGAVDARELSNGEVEFGLARVGPFQFTATGRLAGSPSAGLDPSGRILLLTLPRAENGGLADQSCAR
jgi:hypothetical protein